MIVVKLLIDNKGNAKTIRQSVDYTIKVQWLYGTKEDKQELICHYLGLLLCMII